RRRHLHTAGRRVVSLDDDVLDLDAVDETHLIGEAALLASLRHGRTGRMGDIVATIQADQDRIIREDRRGILVVEGGPGTGKTVVALHRAAYLLYTYRKQLARRGILIIGPNAVAIQPGRMAGGSQGPVVKSWVSASRASMPHLVAVDR